ncbi:AbrB/MazE/SpoVT family DNA-binding domain-containing protein [Leptolyngbya sp. AN03gr2]|uniref:AbrB/MazE/SpoVT family DNA-binding domain-containing protein n=1 Tax=unclassified Leptolyngbya TaxID=2650499 RepID=UPI003D321C66
MQVNEQGQVTIPAEVRERLGFVPGTEVELEVVGDKLEIRKKSRPESIEEWVERVKGSSTSGMTTNEIMQLTRDDD